MNIFHRLSMSPFRFKAGARRPPPPLYADPAPDLMQDGQEEVFSHRAVDLGLTRDPLALGPDACKAADRRSG